MFVINGFNRGNSSVGRGLGQWFAALLLLVLACCVGGRAQAATASPSDWRDLVLYQIITDRFANGNTSNDAVEGNYAPADGFKIHGGDFAGVQAKLDYLQQLGVDGVWISPVVLNANAEYHGYAARDLYSIAPHFGTMAELQALVAACHARGMVVVLDVVLNHMGDLIDSGDAGYPTFKNPANYNLRWRSAKHHAGFFNDLTKFHAHGQIGNYVDPEQILGELAGLDDIKTEDPVVRTELIKAYNWLIDQTDCDGFRIDTVKHVETPFWSTWAPAVHAHADSIGKAKFFMFGEAFDGDDAKNGSYTGTVGGGPYKLDSMLYYPMYFTTSYAFRNADPGDAGTAPAQISARYGALSNYDTTSRGQLVTFLDNHDNARFLGFGSAAESDESKLVAALGWMLTSRGVPCIYYGTEQAFDGGGDPYDREDMFRGSWDFGPSLGDNFNEARPLVQYVRRVSEARRRHEALRRGTTRELYVAAAGAGPYVYERMTANDTVWVAVNNSNAPATLVLPAGPWAPGTALVDAVQPDTVETVGRATFTVRLPARGVRIYESLASRQAAAASERLHVTALSPAHDAGVNDRNSPLRVAFDREVAPEQLTAAFAITPFVDGVWQVVGREGRYFPRVAWSAGVTYKWGLASTLTSRDGSVMPARFDAQFITTGVATGITVPAGYTSDRIARQGLAAPTSIVSIGSTSPLTMLLSDTNRNRLYTLTTGGDLGHWLGDSRWTAPQGIAPDSAGRVSVVDASGVYSIAAARMCAQLTGSTSTTQNGAGSWGPPAFGSEMYLCDPQGNRVTRLAAGNTLQTFATSILGASGLAFTPGGAWGSDLFVSDANLTSIGGSADGAGRICRVTSAGVVSTFVLNAAMLNGVTALTFDMTGAFGGNLFAADLINKRILQITSAGTISVFATGFAGLKGPQCIAFGPDGALYVADAASPQVIRIARAVLTTDVATGPARRGTLELAAAPNPFVGAVALRFTLSSRAEVRLEIVDVTGRRVRLLEAGSLDAGLRTVRWDGRDASGQPSPAGLYFARLSVGGERVVKRVALAR